VSYGLVYGHEKSIVKNRLQSTKLARRKTRKDSAAIALVALNSSGKSTEQVSI